MNRPMDVVIVAGGGCAGLVFARVLSAFAKRVIVIDPATSPLASKQPQGPHTHLVLGSGTEALLEIFPELASNISGFPRLVDPGVALRWITPYGALPQVPTGIKCLVGHRLQILNELHKLLVAQPNVTFMCGVAEHVDFDAATQQFSVAIRNGDEQRVLHADAFFDATGWKSDFLATALQKKWLGVDEIASDPGVSYSSMELTSAQVAHWDLLIAQGDPPKINKSAMIVRFADNKYVLTMCGVKGERTPRRLRDIPAFLQGLSQPREVLDFMESATGTSGLSFYRNGINRIRKIQTLGQVPYFLIGDGLTRLNPYHGFGLSLAFLQALGLLKLFRQGTVTTASFYQAVESSQEALVKYVMGTEKKWDRNHQQKKSLKHWYARRLWEAGAVHKNHRAGRSLLAMLHLKGKRSDLFKLGMVVTVAFLALKRRMTLSLTRQA